MAVPPMPRPELPNPVLAQPQYTAPAAKPQEQFIAAPREFGGAEFEAAVPPPVPATPRAISEILVPLATPRADGSRI